jgi:hypothetical protein
MIVLALLTTALAAPPKLATTDFATVGAIDPALASFLSEHFAARLSEGLGAPVPKTIEGTIFSTH